MTNNEHEGWTNYATWKVYHDIFDGMEYREWIAEEKDESVLADIIQEYTEELVFGDYDDDSFIKDYAKAFLGNVNWQEIAGLLIDQYILSDLWEKEVNSKG